MCVAAEGKDTHGDTERAGSKCFLFSWGGWVFDDHFTLGKFFGDRVLESSSVYACRYLFSSALFFKPKGMRR